MGDMSAFNSPYPIAGGMAITNCNHEGIQIIQNGFQVQFKIPTGNYYYVYLNNSEGNLNPYRYIAFK